MNRALLLPFVAGLLLLLPRAAGSAELGAGVEEIQRCAEKNLPARTARQEVVFERRDRAGDTRRMSAVVHWKRGEDGLSRALIRVLEPAEERGTAFLLLEREGRDPDMFTYLPELKRVRRITARTVSGSFLGTDFSYEDIQELQAMAERSRVERLPDGEVGGRPAYVLAATPTPDSGSAYERIVSYVDRESCVTLRTLFVAPGDKTSKELSVAFADVERAGERWLPRKAKLLDTENGSETSLEIREYEHDVDLPDRLFSQSELEKGN
jgi:outer membrane lipoprotein-sorting protein